MREDMRANDFFAVSSSCANRRSDPPTPIAKARQRSTQRKRVTRQGMIKALTRVRVQRYARAVRVRCAGRERVRV